jgi:hypothetical protein
MTTSLPMGEAFAQMTNAAVEAFTFYADANQKVLRELVDLSAIAAKEGVRLYAELQSSAVEAMRDSQAFLLRRQWDGEIGSLGGAYQRGWIDSVEGAQRAVRLFEDGAQALTRSAERLSVSAEQAGQEIQATLTQLVDRLPSLYAAQP